jgi:hypothetical protein
MINQLAASLFGVDQRRLMFMVAYVPWLIQLLNLIIHAVTGRILSIPCDPVFASKVYRKARVRRGRYLLLAHCTRYCRNACS